MTVYRIVLTCSHPVIGEQTYTSPRVFFCHPMMCGGDYEMQFSAYCHLLFTAQNPDYNEEEITYKVEYRQYDCHPCRDIWNRVVSFFKYGM